MIADKKEYSLDQDEIKILQAADQAGHRGLIWYDKFAISVPHISSIYLNYRRIKNQIEAGSTEDGKLLTHDEIHKKIEELKKKAPCFQRAP